MTATIKHVQTIKIKVSTRPSLSAVPNFVPKSLVSADANNALKLGTDQKLYINPLNKIDW